MADYKPGDLLVGIVDFFAIVLPGAMLTFLGLKFEKKIFDGSLLPALGEGPPRWIAFILVAYLVGNIVYLLGASSLDWIYGATYRQFQSRQTDDALYKAAKNLKGKTLIPLSMDEIENPYKWSRAMVRVRNSSAAAEIDRLEASSKFFRSLVIVLFVSLFALSTEASRWQLGLCLIVLTFSCLRYASVSIEELQHKGYLPKSALLTRASKLIEKIQWRKRLVGILFWLTTVTLIGLTIWKKSTWVTPSVSLLMLYLSFWCYASQRWKMTQTAYLYFVLLSTMPNEKDKTTAEP